MLAMSVEATASQLPPKVKSIGPCADPPHEMYVVRFDLNQVTARVRVRDRGRLWVRVKVRVRGRVRVRVTSPCADPPHRSL